ncbi:hypothetical protein [Shewanella decolorationis]|uniref:hypothetical protein n=1 Tax=Shewanella decolorationis TaxID=256839 RepID=UPI00105730D7|nr:hypothetical protein [Shewanella decolorationis]
MNRPKRLNTSFSTADAELPEIHLFNGELLVRFKDWRSKKVIVSFAVPIAFKWEFADFFYEGEKDDSCYVIENSGWLKTYSEQGEILEGDIYQHFKFNFNGIGQLEVIAHSFTELT